MYLPGAVVYRDFPKIGTTFLQASKLATPFSLKLHCGSDGVKAIAPEWRALAEKVGGMHTMMQPDYHQVFAENLAGEPADICVAMFYQAQDLRAVLPLTLKRIRRYGVGFRRLEFPALPMSVRKPLLAEGVGIDDLLVSLKMHWQHATGENWDTIKLSGISEFNANAHAAPLLGKQWQASVSGKNNVISLQEADYIAKRLSGNMRSNLKRRGKRLSQLGDYSFTTIFTVPELEAAFDAFIETEAAGWKSVRGGKRAIKLNPHQHQFYKALMQHYAAAGRCHIHLLELNGKAIASDFCLLTDTTCHSLKHGYDEDFSDVTPSNLLRQYTINYYSENTGIAFIDLISGYDWQDRWKPDPYKVWELSADNTNFGGYVVRVMRWLSSIIKR